MWITDTKRTLAVAEKRPSAAFSSFLVVAAYLQVRFTPRDFGSLASACLPVGRGIFEQPEKEHFFRKLLEDKP
jgi:hypothetical protein